MGNLTLTDTLATTTENLEYLIAAYTIIWIAISGYVLRLGRKQSQLQRELDALAKEVGERESDQ